MCAATRAVTFSGESVAETSSRPRSAPAWRQWTCWSHSAGIARAPPPSRISCPPAAAGATAVTTPSSTSTSSSSPRRSLVRGAEGLRAGQGQDTDIAKQEGHARIVPRNQWVLSWTRTMARWPPLSGLASQVCRGASSASASAR